VKSDELGITDATIHTRSHLGRILHPGDTVLGFNVVNCNTNNSYFEKMNKDQIPDVIITKKVYADKNTRRKRRKWKLRHMAEIEDDDAKTVNTTDDRDYEDFLEDLEEDPDIRERINIYKKQVEEVATDTEGEDEEIPRVSLAEMLDDLNIEEPMQQ